MAIEYHVIIEDYHRYVGHTPPCIREEIVRDPGRIYNFESGVQSVLGVYVVNTREDSHDTYLNLLKLKKCLEKIIRKEEL